jgi:hypothetical protein
VASGAGFAIVENLLNGAVAGQEAWITAALTRATASVMHCFTGGLVGWGWGQLWTGKRFGRFFGSLAGAVALHAVWNGVAVVAVLLQVGATARGDGFDWITPSGLGVAASALLLGILAVSVTIALPVVARRLVREPGAGAGSAAQNCVAESSSGEASDDGRPAD